MSAESADAFFEDLQARIAYFREEHDLTYSEAIGVLRMLSYKLEKEGSEKATPD